MPLVSVIVPVFNTEKYLPKCLDSLINQTYKNIEIIVVDDGSTDESLKICQNYAKNDSRIKVISQQNQGPSVARNNALKVATGDYICFVDSDDYISGATIEKAVMNMTDEVDMVIWGVNVFSDDNLPYVGWFDNYLNFQEGGICELTTDRKFQISVVPWNKMFRNSIIKKYNITFPVGRLYEDNAFWWKYTMFCLKAFFLTEKLHYYNLRPNSLRGNVINKQCELECDRIYMVEDVYNFCSQNSIQNQNTLFFERLLLHSFKSAYEVTTNFEAIAPLAYDLIKKLNFLKSDNKELQACIKIIQKAIKEKTETKKDVIALINYAKNINLNDNPDVVNTVFEIYKKLYKAGKADEIIQTVKLFLVKYPNNPLFIQLLGDTFCFLKNDRQTALVCYKRYIAINPDNAVVLNLISDTYGDNGDVYNQLLYKQKALNV